MHGGIANNVKVNLDWIDAEVFEREDPAPYLEGVHGILVPGGFGERGTEGKILAAKFARTRHVPYFGICFGMQMAVIEAARSLCHIIDASSTEFGPAKGAGGRTDDRVDGAGGSCRSAPMAAISAAPCGSAPMKRGCRAIPRSRRSMARLRFPSAIAIAGRSNTDYRERLERAGLAFTGTSPDGLLPETVEYPDHPWFIGVQYHPELKSRPFDPHPLFKGFIGAAVEQSRLV